MDSTKFCNNADAIYGKALAMYDNLYTNKKIDSEIYSKGIVDIVKTALLTAVDITTKEGLIAIQEATGLAQIQEIQQATQRSNASVNADNVIKSYQVTNILPAQYAEILCATKRNNDSIAADNCIKNYQVTCILPAQAMAMSKDLEMKDIQTIVALADAEVKKAQVTLADKEIEMKNGQLTLMAKDIVIKEMQTQMATIDVDVKSVQMQTAVKDMAAKEFQLVCTMPLQAIELQQKISDSAAMTDKQLRVAEVDLRIKNYQLDNILPAQASDAAATARLKAVQSDVLAPIQVEEASAKMIETVKASCRAETMATVDVALKCYQLNNLLPVQREETVAKTDLNKAQTDVVNALRPYQLYECMHKSTVAEVQACVSRCTTASQITSAAYQVALQNAQIDKVIAEADLVMEQKTQLVNSVNDNKRIRAIQAQSDLFSSLAMGKRQFPIGLVCSYIGDISCLTGTTSSICYCEAVSCLNCLVT